MAVVYQNKSEVKVASGTQITIPVPVGFSAGDLLIAYVTKDDDNAITPPAGWTLIQNVAGGTAMNLWVGWRIAVAGDTEWTWTGDSEAYYGVILRYKGHDPTNPIHASGSATGSTQYPIAPSVGFENLNAGSLVIQVFGADDNDIPYTVPSPLESRFNDEATTTGGAGGDRSTIGQWVSPTGFTEGNWALEARAYDENVELGTSYALGGNSWTDYLELTIGSLSCNWIRFYSDCYDVAEINQISVDVYYADDWHNIYEGAFANNEWVKKEIPAGVQTVTAVRFKMYNDDSIAHSATILEVDFWEVTGNVSGTGNTGTAVFTMNAIEEWAAVTAIIEAAVAEGDFTYEGTGTFTYSGTATQTYTKNFLCMASGQFTYSGTAGQVYSKNYLYEGSGELAFSGEAVIIFGLAFVGSGELAYSGEAVIDYTLNYLCTAVGELIYSGEAIFSYLCNFLFSGSGELAYSGEADYSVGFSYIASGELTYSGSAVCEYTIAGEEYEYVGTGSFAYSGTATQSYTFNYLCVGTGTISYSGSATQTHTRYYLYEASGEFTYSGNAIITIGFAYIGDGELIYAGAAEYSYQVGADFEYVGSGSYAFSGTATQTYSSYYLYTGSGVFNYSGNAVYRYTVLWSKVTKEKGDWNKVDKTKGKKIILH